MRSFFLIASIALFASASGCDDACTKLADKACELSGEGSDACERARARADKTSATDKRNCEWALEVVQALPAAAAP